MHDHDRLTAELATACKASCRAGRFDLDHPRRTWVYQAERTGQRCPYYFTRFTVEPETYADGFDLTVVAGFLRGELIASPLA